MPKLEIKDKSLKFKFSELNILVKSFCINCYMSYNSIFRIFKDLDRYSASLTLQSYL